jgi:Protein of unknown function, DUF488
LLAQIWVRDESLVDAEPLELGDDVLRPLAVVIGHLQRELRQRYSVVAILLAHIAEVGDLGQAPDELFSGDCQRAPPSPRLGSSHLQSPNVKRLITIGVYDWDASTFLEALRAADVRLLLDVRQRRGVRGAQYAWANSQRLQAALVEAGIDYAHHKELAPTTELRQLQYAEDARQGVGKRSRVELASAYVRGYTREVLDRSDLQAVYASLPSSGAGALMCVERDPEACHRSLVAERVSERYQVDVRHLRPD